MKKLRKTAATLFAFLFICMTALTDTAGAADAADVTDTVSAADTSNTADTASAADTVDGTVSEAVIQYIYVDEKTVQAPGEQNIVVGFADETLAPERVILHGSSSLTGEQFDAEAVRIIGNTALFTIEYPQGAAADTIGLDGITYEAAGQEHTLELAKEEIHASYDVCPADAQPETYAGTNDLEGTGADSDTDIPELTVYSLDDNGNEVAESGEVIENTVESVLDQTGDAANLQEDAAKPQEDAASLQDEESALQRASGRSAVDRSASQEGASGRSTEDRQVTVVICAGHDKTHTGASGLGLREEELTFQVAQYCKEALEQYEWITVYTDRDSIECAYPGESSSYCLNQRVKDAAAKGADVFVDIHFNTGGGQGAEVYYPNSSYNSAIGKDGEGLANEILDELSALGLENRGAKIKDCTTDDTDENGVLDDYFTTNYAAKQLGMTGIIVEHAFLDNASDAAKLQDENFLRSLGEADAAGIAAHYENGRVEFEDVPTDAWYYEVVSYVNELGIMTGMNSHYFGASEAMERGQIAAVLHRMEGEPKARYVNRFPDVPDGVFFTEPVMWASDPDVGVIAGYEDGTFGPSDDVTREQFVTMLYRYAQYQGSSLEINGDLNAFPDAASVSAFSREAMQWAVKNGIIRGDQGCLKPQDSLSRAAGAAMIQRFCEKYM